MISGKYEKERGGWCSPEVREGHEESINHILLHCVKTKGFMGDVLCFFWVVLGTSPLVRGTLLG